jgi:hypothetical protein
VLAHYRSITFQAVYATFWKKPFESFLDDAPASDGEILKHISPATVQKLQLGDASMKYDENVLLIRNEFLSAFDTLESWWNSNKKKGGVGGVVVTGQPGIGECYFFLLALWY